MKQNLRMQKLFSALDKHLKNTCHARLGGHPQASQQMDSRFRGNDNTLVPGETSPMHLTLNHNCHSEVLRGIPLNLAKCNNNYFTITHKTIPLRRRATALKKPAGVAHA